ncbi:MAG TPA: DUF4398 domain-containing protein, partial [Nannocystaceae bacterium]|nr:DUF4398 domain-containing protein [Nannocystaceae bacterium]
GCANKQLSQTKVADTEAAMRSAEEIGAASEPQASLHLRYAQDQLKHARKLMDDGDEKEARRMLDRAQADAQLALALARTERDRAQAKAAWAEVDELRQQSAPEPGDQGNRIEPLEGADKENGR